MKQQPSLDRLYEIASATIDWICKKVQCEPQQEKCKDCSLYMLSSNIDFRYHMGWYVCLSNSVRSLYMARSDWVEKILDEKKRGFKKQETA